MYINSTRLKVYAQKLKENGKSIAHSHKKTKKIGIIQNISMNELA
jgi:hypothetical protein